MVFRKAGSSFLVLVLCMSIILLVMSMDHGKFDLCDKKPFCNRLRDFTSSEASPSTHPFSHYQITRILSTREDRFVFVLTHKPKYNEDALLNKKQFFHPELLGVVEILQHGIFRFRLREKVDADDNKPMEATILEKRYEVKDSILETSKKPRKIFLSIENTSGLFRMAFEDSNISSELVVSIGNADKPFSMTLRVNNKDAIIFNERGLLQVEAQTPIPAFPDPTNETVLYNGESATGIDIFFPGSDAIYGLPERATDLLLKATRGSSAESGAEPYRLYNLDVFRYELDNHMGLYGTVPLLYSVKPDLTSGVLVMNPSETFVDISKSNHKVFGRSTSSHWMSETGIIDIYLLPGPTPKDVAKQYGFLTGNAPLPQLFSLGYHQCRWNYKDEDDVRGVDYKFDEHNIPYDVLWLDIEHTDQKKYFTWDSTLFPDSTKMLADLDAKGRKMVTISDPHIKRVQGYHVHDDATSKGFYVKNSDGTTDYEGDCWPGKSSWIDFFNPEARKFYAGLYDFNSYKGSYKNLYTWIDMNEPSVFSGPEITMHKDAKHFGGLQHKEVHNQYGFYQGMATYEGHLARAQGKDRPFILSRSFFAGSQRYVAIWTGDNEAKWSHLAKAQPMILSTTLGGIIYIGCDVGGFFDNPETDLLVRWYQAGAFYPFFRAHAHIETQRREPWLFGEENTQLIRSAIARRYTLIPYYYTLAFHANLTNIPIMRPLFMEFPTEAGTYDIQDQFMIGSAILVKPVVDKEAVRMDVYLPGEKSDWYDYESGELIEAGKGFKNFKLIPEDIPVFLRAGSIIPLKMRMRRSTTQQVNDPYTLKIALDTNGGASGDLYLDDGHSFDYNRGIYIYRNFQVKQVGVKLTTISSTVGTLSHASVPSNPDFYDQFTQKFEKVVIFGYPSKPSSVSVSIVGQVIVDPETGTQTPVPPSPLAFDYNAETRVLVIRKPDVSVTADWQISIHN